MHQKLARSGEYLGSFLAGNLCDLVDPGGKHAKLCFGETIDWEGVIKRAKNFLVSVRKAETVFGEEKTDNQSLGRFFLRVTRLVQHGGRQQYQVIAVNLVGNAFQKVDRARREENMNLKVGMQMLKLHIDLTGAAVKIKEIKGGIFQVVYNDETLVFVLDGCGHGGAPFVGDKTIL